MSKPTQDGADPTNLFEYKTALRDWFAGMALPALIQLLSNTKQADEAMRRLGLGGGQFDLLCAKCAYDYADAMLAAREQKEGER